MTSVILIRGSALFASSALLPAMAFYQLPHPANGKDPRNGSKTGVGGLNWNVSWGEQGGGGGGEEPGGQHGCSGACASAKLSIGLSL